MSRGGKKKKKNSMSEAMTTASLRRILDDYLKHAVASLEGEAEYLESTLASSVPTEKRHDAGTQTTTSSTLYTAANTLRRSAEMVRLQPTPHKQRAMRMCVAEKKKMGEIKQRHCTNSPLLILVTWNTIRSFSFPHDIN